MLKRYTELLSRHSILGFFRIVLARLSPFEKWRYTRAVKSGRVYLGEHLSARQGVTARHHYMAALVAKTEVAEPRLLEVGCWAGGSAVVFARALKNHFGKGHLTCVDPWEVFYEQGTGNVGNINADHRKAMGSGKVFELFQHNLRAAGIADLVSAHRSKFGEWTTNQTFDLIYIDGDHRYDSVRQDLEKAHGLLKIGGFLCGDDLERQYHEVDPDFCEQHLTDDFVFEPKKALAHFHPGVTKAVGEFFTDPVSAYEGFWVMQKAGENRYVSVQLDAR